jgi:hypothetical protein
MQKGDHYVVSLAYGNENVPRWLREKKINDLISISQVPVQKTEAILSIPREGIFNI